MKNNRIETCIVIPCYNEAERFPIQEYVSFILKEPTVMLCFVNDGSKDDTLKIIKELEQRYKDQVGVLSQDKNQGKAAAIRKGVHYCNQHYTHSYIAYLDADLSSSLQECVTLKHEITTARVFVFGSRIMRLGSLIDRKRYRFLIGRCLATLISRMLQLRIYDTQCGCKLFTKKISEELFAQPFLSRWLFDVELFYRMLLRYGTVAAKKMMYEVPLQRWIDTEDSRVKVSYFLKLWIDLYTIHKYYTKKKRVQNTLQNTVINHV